MSNPLALLRSSKSRPLQAGFTLIEVSLVVLIVGILLSLAMPAFNMGGRRLDSAAARLASLIGYLHDEAALRGRVYRLTLDLDTEAYEVTELQGYGDSGDAKFAEVWDPYSNAVELPAGVSLGAVEIAGESLSTGRRDLYFLPEGGTGTISLWLEGRGEMTSRRLTLRSATGRVDVEEVPL